MLNKKHSLRFMRATLLLVKFYLKGYISKASNIFHKAVMQAKYDL